MAHWREGIDAADWGAVLSRGVIAILAFFLAVYVYGLRLVQRFRFRHIPGPSPPWLFGQLGDVSKLGQARAYQKWGAEHGPGMHAVHVGGRSFLHVNNPDTARKIMYGGARPLAVVASVVPDKIRAQNLESIAWKRGTEWRDLRAAWQPMFFTGSLENYMSFFDQAASLLVEEMSWAVAKGQSVDMYTAILDMSMNVIAQAAFGVNLHTQKADASAVKEEDKEGNRRLREAVQHHSLPQKQTAWTAVGLLFPFLLPLLRKMAHRYPDEALEEVITSRATLDEVLQRLIREHRHATERDGRAESDNAGPHSNKRGVAPGSFIDLLVKGRDRITGKTFPDHVIAAQVLTMLLAGFETTASLITFTTYLLARSCNLDKQGRVAEEIRALGEGGAASLTDLEEKLPYTDAVLKESLRLYPPLHQIFREAETDMTVEGLSVPRGSAFHIPVYAVHNDSRVWGEDVAAFKPERWLTEDPVAAKKAKNSFFAFGDGPRVCPGSRFALAQAKVALVRIFHDYNLELQPGQEPIALKFSLTMSPKEAIFIRPVPFK